MNSNTYNETSDNSSFSTPSKLASAHLVLHLPSTIYNPTTADFERLSRQYARYFFYLLDQQPKLPKITSLKLHNKNKTSYILTHSRLY